MVIASYFRDKFPLPQREKYREQARKEMAAGRREWNERRLDARPEARTSTSRCQGPNRLSHSSTPRQRRTGPGSEPQEGKKERRAFWSWPGYLVYERDCSRVLPQNVQNPRECRITSC